MGDAGTPPELGVSTTESGLGIRKQNEVGGCPTQKASGFREAASLQVTKITALDSDLCPFPLPVLCGRPSQPRARARATPGPVPSAPHSQALSWGLTSSWLLTTPPPCLSVSQQTASQAERCLLICPSNRLRKPAEVKHCAVNSLPGCKQRPAVCTPLHLALAGGVAWDCWLPPPSPPWASSPFPSLYQHPRKTL